MMTSWPSPLAKYEGYIRGQMRYRNSKPLWSGLVEWPFDQNTGNILKMTIVTFETIHTKRLGIFPLSLLLSHSQCSLPRKIISWSFQPFCERQSISLLFTMFESVRTEVWPSLKDLSIHPSCNLSIYVVIALLFRVRWCESIHRLIWSSIRHLVWHSAIIQQTI